MSRPIFTPALNPKTLSQRPVLSNNIFTIWLPRRDKSQHYYIFCVCMRQSVHCIAAGINSVAASGKSQRKLGENKAPFRLVFLSLFLCLRLSKPAPVRTRGTNLCSRILEKVQIGAHVTNAGCANAPRLFYFSPTFFHLWPECV